MPNFGGKNARPGKNARAAGKPREDGRGGRAPHRDAAAPKGKRPAFFEKGDSRPSAGRTSDREMRGGREDRGRDWSPEGRTERKPRHGSAGGPRREFGSDRPARSFDRDERPARRDGDDRGPRREFGSRDDRPARNFDGPRLSLIHISEPTRH